MDVPDRPHLQALSEVRSDLATSLRPALPGLSDEVIAAIRQSVPEYAKPLEGSFGRGIRAGVDEALGRFVQDLERPGADTGRWRAVYLNLGRGEVRQGRTLEALLAAYRVGARVAWRRVAEAAGRAGAHPGELTALAEAIFAYIDELSALSAEGYAAEQAASAGEAQRRRERLVRALVEGAAPDALAAAAEAAAWQQPSRAAVLLVRERPAATLTARLGQGAVAAELEEGLAGAVVPDAEGPGRDREIVAAAGGHLAALGPERAIDELPESFRRARQALDLAERGVAAREHGPLRASEHRAELVVHGDPGLLREHADAELAPLAGLSPASRERLLATLRAWIEHPGRPTEVARAVHVHPQTARYRLRRLRELLGDIDDPERRFALALALRSPGVA